MNDTVKKDTVEKVFEIFKNGWNKQVILYGPPGTSKTYSSTIIAAKMLGYNGDDFKGSKDHLIKKAGERFKLVQFHPAYCYEDFVRGIKVETVESQLKYTVTPRIFEEFCKTAAKAAEEENFVFVIDEINRAPLASVLGELIYALEYRGSAIESSYTLENNQPLVVPPNVYIIGTMNTADRSIGSIDYAVRRRFAFVPVKSKPDAIENSWSNKEVGQKAKELYKKINGKDGLFSEELLADPDMDAEDIKIGHTYFLGQNDESKDTKEYLEYRVQYQIVPIYLEYIKDGIIKKEGKDKLKEILEINGFGDISESIY